MGPFCALYVARIERSEMRGSRSRMSLRSIRATALLQPPGRGAKLFGDPIDDVVDDQRAVVGAAVLGAAVGEVEDLELAVRAVGRGLIELLGVPQRDLPVVLAMHDQERAGDVGGDLLQGHLPGYRQRLLM